MMSSRGGKKIIKMNNLSHILRNVGEYLIKIEANFKEGRKIKVSEHDLRGEIDSSASPKKKFDFGSNFGIPDNTHSLFN